MYRRYTTRYNDMEALAPKFPSPPHRSQSHPPNLRQPQSAKDSIENEPHPKAKPELKKEDSEILHLRENNDAPHKGGLLGGQGIGGMFGDIFKGSLFKDGNILGRFKFDDILIVFMILMLLQDKENQDIPLLLALGYVFIGDKFFSL